MVRATGSSQELLFSCRLSYLKHTYKRKRPHTDLDSVSSATCSLLSTDYLYGKRVIKAKWLNIALSVINSDSMWCMVLISLLAYTPLNPEPRTSLSTHARTRALTHTHTQLCGRSIKGVPVCFSASSLSPYLSVWWQEWWSIQDVKCVGAISVRSGFTRIC